MKASKSERPSRTQSRSSRPNGIGGSRPGSILSPAFLPHSPFPGAPTDIRTRRPARSRLSRPPFAAKTFRLRPNVRRELPSAGPVGGEPALRTQDI